MNPYSYIDPPNGSEYNTIPARFTVAPLTIKVKTFQSQSKNFSKSTYFIFFIGIFFGFFITNLIGSKILSSSLGTLCLSEISHVIPTDAYSDNLYKNDMQKTLVRNKKNLVYIGVMTANKYIDSRAKSVFETWGKHLPGKIAFFTSERSQTSEHIPLVKLKGVTDAYPPQKKSFMMLKYMYDNHINDFEFFMRADDDLYVRTERLEKFLKSLNSSRAYYIGQAGIGNNDEFGHLSLSEQENFCMGGPGVILSKFTLERIAPHIKECFLNMKSTHEDVEVGRCVQKFAGIPCTWSYEMQNIFYHNYSGINAFSGSLKQKEVNKAITMHPIKNPFHLRRVDAYVKSLMIKEKEYELVQTMDELKKFVADFNITMPQFNYAEEGILVNQIGLISSIERLKKLGSLRVVEEYDFYTRNVHQLNDYNPRHRAPSYINEGINDVVREIMETINRVSKERGRVIDFKEVLYGYHSNNPLSSAGYTLDLLLLYKKYRGKKMTVPVRRHAYIQVPYGLLYVRESPNSVYEAHPKSNMISQLLNMFMLQRGLPFISKQQVAQNESTERQGKRINFILPLSGRYSTFQRFMDDFEAVCLEHNENVQLIIVSFKPKLEEQDTRDLVDNVLNDLRSKYSDAFITHIRSETPFARARAIEIGASKTNSDDLLLFIDVDITFTSRSLERMRWLTIEGKQMYFPIVFSEYDPVILENKNTPRSHFVVNEEVGYWRSFGYGIAVMYHSDLRAVGGLNTSIIGWGKEDVDLFEKVVKSKNLTIMRAPDPDLVHIFHHVECDASLEAQQFEMCQGSRYSTYASPHTLAKMIRKRPDVL